MICRKQMFYGTLIITAFIFISSCAGNNDTHQFDPVPQGNVHSTNLDDHSAPRNHYNPIVYPSPLPERVKYELNDIQTRYPRGFQIGLDRAQHFLPFIESAFTHEGVPKELIWLAMVESQFHSTAVSRSNAKGMWQFMNPAGRRFGLRIDTYVDERYDWKRQTQAAIDYLTTLYKFFDEDWSLAITAYNMGEGGLSRVIKAHGGERDFWKLVEIADKKNTMRTETQKYYPRLLASAMVAQNPEKFGFKKNPVKAQDVIDVVVEGMYSLDDLDVEMAQPKGTLAALNPALLQGVTPPNGEFRVYVPRTQREKFIIALKSVPNRKTGNGTHKVKRGETISLIARNYGVSQKELIAVNNIRSVNRLSIGQSLIIPGQIVTADHTSHTKPPVRSGARGDSKIYAVMKGDTLSEIAGKYNIKISDVQSWNNMGRRTKLNVGDKLYVSAPDNSAPSVTASQNVVMTSYSVKKGDTFSSIAARYGVKVSEIQHWNNKGNSINLKIGEKLMIANADIQAPAPSNTSVAYTVVKGDTLSVIAGRYKVKVAHLQDWNGLGKSTALKIGQKLKVNGSPAISSKPVVQAITVPKQKQQYLYHTVQKGEYPALIAREHNISLDELFVLNSKVDKNTVLHIGDKLIVEKQSVSVSPSVSVTSPKPEKNTAVASTESKKVHTVVKGDTPGGIAARYKVNTRDLLAWNNLSPKSVIKIGQKLNVYTAENQSRAASSEKEGEELTHIVKKGQNPWNIAKKYGVKVDELHRWNKWNNNHVLQIGDKVTIRK